MGEAAPSRWLSDWKAVIIIIGLELFLITSIVNYYAYFIDRNLSLSNISNLTVGICALLVITPNYYLFIHTNIWKEYVKEFDQLPKRKNIIGSWMTLFVIIFVLFNFIYSFCLYYKM